MARKARNDPPGALHLFTSNPMHREHADRCTFFVRLSQWGQKAGKSNNCVYLWGSSSPWEQADGRTRYFEYIAAKYWMGAFESVVTFVKMVGR